MLFYVMFKARYAGLKLTGHLIVAGLYNDKVKYYGKKWIKEKHYFINSLREI